MVVYAGIDEAGYGPLFGPLCVACTSFRIGDATANDATPNLWRVLSRVVCRKPGDSRGRIAVNDSKVLKRPATRVRHPLADLERGVLSFLACLDGADGNLPGTCDGMLAAVGAGSFENPWYTDRSELPVAGDPALLRIAAGRLARGLEQAGIALTSLRCAVVDAGAFNRGLRTFGNKAGVNLHHALRLVEQVRQDHPDAQLAITVDRHGGRIHYRRPLQDTWPDARIAILDESEMLSRYRLELNGQVMTVAFICRGEAEHLPIALSSMTAKYIRELLMLRLNAWFCQRVPKLKPTAGYVQDGRRFLRDIEPVIRRLDLPRVELIRQA